MGRPLQFDKQEALKRSTELFIQKGYSATSLSELVETIEIVKPSFYNAFGSKEGLLLECLNVYSQKALESFREVLYKDANLANSIRSLFSFVVDMNKSRRKNPGCLIVSCAIESDNPLVKEVLQRHGKELHKLITDRLNQGLENEKISISVDTKALASSIGIFLQGLSLSYKQSNKIASLEASVKTMEALTLALLKVL